MNRLNKNSLSLEIYAESTFRISYNLRAPRLINLILRGRTDSISFVEHITEPIGVGGLLIIDRGVLWYPPR